MEATARAEAVARTGRRRDGFLGTVSIASLMFFVSLGSSYNCAGVAALTVESDRISTGSPQPNPGPHEPI
jgi:hypothetical protein